MLTLVQYVKTTVLSKKKRNTLVYAAKLQLN